MANAVHMLTPPALKNGDTVAIVAPARSISKDEIEPAIELLTSWGLQVATGDHLFSQHHQFAGTDSERASDMQQMLDNEHVRAIFCARGGYGTVRTIRFLDFDRFLRYPKWIIGFSDITVLHSYINEQLSVKTLHAQMPVNFPRNRKENQALRLLKETIFGKSPAFSWETKHEETHESKITGQLTGGNLSVLYSLAGTPYDISTENKILFMEDLEEYLYHIDRMFMNLKLSGKLDNLKGLLVGGMTDMNDNKVPFGKTAYEIIYDVTKDLEFPIFSDCPAGHTHHNLPLIMGGTITIWEKEGMINVVFDD